MPLHRQSQEFLSALAALDRPGWDAMPPEESRAVFASLTDAFGSGPDLPVVEDIDLEGVQARRYSPSQDDVLPGIVYFHGGGWVIGNLDTHESVCRRLAADSNCVVVAIDYRLAPENPFPAAVEDCYNATCRVAANSNMLNIAPDKIVVAGDSAGGNLATVVAMRARDTAGPNIALQVLLYPVIEPDFESDTYTEFAEGFGLTRNVMRFFWQQYLASDADASNALAVPTLAKSLAGLPKSLVVTAEYDVLRDEGERYAKRLSESGCDVTLIRYDGMLHGFIHFSGVFDDGVNASAKIGRFIKRHFGN